MGDEDAAMRARMMFRGWVALQSGGALLERIRAVPPWTDVDYECTMGNPRRQMAVTEEGTTRDERRRTVYRRRHEEVLTHKRSVLEVPGI